MLVPPVNASGIPVRHLRSNSIKGNTMPRNSDSVARRSSCPHSSGVELPYNAARYAVGSAGERYAAVLGNGKGQHVGSDHA